MATVVSKVTKEFCSRCKFSAPSRTTCTSKLSHRIAIRLAQDASAIRRIAAEPGGVLIRLIAIRIYQKQYFALFCVGLSLLGVGEKV